MALIAGKIAIITGSSRGIGRAMSSTGYAYALKLAGNGASIVVNYSDEARWITGQNIRVNGGIA